MIRVSLVTCLSTMIRPWALIWRNPLRPDKRVFNWMGCSVTIGQPCLLGYWTVWLGEERSWKASRQFYCTDPGRILRDCSVSTWGGGEIEQLKININTRIPRYSGRGQVSTQIDVVCFLITSEYGALQLIVRCKPEQPVNRPRRCKAKSH